MTPHEAASALAEPIGTVGSYFYFTPATAARGEALGLQVLAFYALGRGGVLGDPEPEEVERVFWSFKPGVIAGLYGAAREVQPTSIAVPAHLEAADAYAMQTFGAVPSSDLEALASLADAVCSSAPVGRWPLFDGYRALGWPDHPVARAYRAAIVLRELRGGVHIDAVTQAGLTPEEACYLDREGRFFALHGFTDADIPEVDDAVRARRIAAEDDTTLRMAELLSVAHDGNGAAVQAATAMRAAVKSPVPVD